ncbi:uncharacterized protein EDB91DRAFT_1236246 [Suillus paluster]|uniref:uncharacterized protein n=1 Tax=Suillus paluster TaxID=48578 RepID=UPI001B863727|nr:uncharacterized protein EDB91DRAFT_1236246 [Suillus paluster]KAG1745944.1 hypothetical protein EDB91DRAFT_1236246 [Suillus paluster]
MATTSPPSVILTDALASLNKAVNIAFTSIQDQTRLEVTQASAEAREARRERDEAVKALHELRLEEQAWKQEAGSRKAAVEQAELTVKHHLETITQLRYEAEQWKQQCLRLEDTSRQEATSWKEQFLRVEQERYKLAARVDELIEEQLSHTVQTHSSNTPLMTMFRYPNASASISDPSTSTRLRLPPYASELPDESASTSRAPKPISAQQLPTPISENRRATGDKSKQYLIRRVQAVIEVPVKEESVETMADEALSASTRTSKPSLSGTSKKPPSNPATSIPTSSTRPARKVSTKRQYVEIDEDEEQDKISERCKSGSDVNDEDEVDSSEEEDDELMMGAEENRREVYGTKRIAAMSNLKAVLQAPVKKRKLVSGTAAAPAGAGKKPLVKSARG